MLILSTSFVDFACVPADLMSAFQLIPYQSAEDAVFKAVSYTHLDVYKRQASDREGAFRKSSRIFPGTERYRAFKQTSGACHAGCCLLYTSCGGYESCFNIALNMEELM